MSLSSQTFSVKVIDFKFLQALFIRKNLMILINLLKNEKVYIIILSLSNLRKKGFLLCNFFCSNLSMGLL